MSKYKNQITLLIVFVVMSLFNVEISAQAKRPKAVQVTEINAVVTDQQGNVLPHVVVTSGEGSVTSYTDSKGMVKLTAKVGSLVVFEAQGYDTNVIDVTDSKKTIHIYLNKSPLLDSKRDMYQLSGGINTSARYNVGAISSIKGSEVENYADMIVANSFQGKLSGLQVIMSAGGLANNPPSMNIRGLHRESGNGIITIIDGVERDINTIIPEEIENVQVLKDVSTKLLYGPRAANGVLMITTKKGEKHKRVIKATAEYGIGLPVDMPEYLNSYDYVRLYNEARNNDGLSPLYSEKDIEGYKNSTGPDDLRYPNLDYYDFFLKKNTDYRKFNFELSGGNDNAQYAFVGGYVGNTGLQKVGEIPFRDRFNARGNLNIMVNDIISANIGIAGMFDIYKRGALNHAQTFAALSSHRPNEYPLLIADSILTPDSVGYPNLGAGLYNVNNLYADLQYGGFQKEQNINGQLNFGLDFDFNDFIQGLSAKAMITFDNYFFGAEGISTTAPVYSQRWIENPDGQDSLLLIMRKMGDKNDQLVLTNKSTFRTTSLIGSLNYERKLNSASLFNADYIFNYYLSESTGENQDVKFVNNVLRLNLINNEKYIANVNFGYMGSNKFSGANQFTFSSSGGLGWILSEESFMTSTQSWMDYLKLKLTAGVLAYDGQTDYNLYRDRWGDNGNYRFNNGLTASRTTFYNIGNPNLKWEKSGEVNFGIEALLFNKKLWIETNYFNELRYDIIQKLGSQYSAMYGGMFQHTNWGKVLNQGVELDVRFSDRIGQLSYQIGSNLIYSKNKVLQTDEINHTEEYLKQVGRPSDAMFGYVAIGLFGKDVDLNASIPHQTLGAYQEGDIAYENLNNDDIIDSNDRKMLSNSFPRVHLGVDFSMDYKGFGIYILGTAQLGYSKYLNNSYFWNRGEDKYSVYVLNRYHPTENPDGTYPRLTTQTGSSNNFVNSTFWLTAADFLRIKNVELSYTLVQPPTNVLRSIKFFARANNVMQFSTFDTLDPEVPNAGLTNYPLLRNITGGLTVSF